MKKVQDSGATGVKGGEFQERRDTWHAEEHQRTQNKKALDLAGDLLESVWGWRERLPASSGRRRMPLFCKLGDERKYRGLLVFKMGRKRM